MYLWQVMEAKATGGFFLTKKKKFGGKERNVYGNVFYAKKEDALRMRDIWNDEMINRYSWREKK